MVKRLKHRRRWHNFTEAGYRPYATAIGQLALAWNDLHEKLGHLFVRAMGFADEVCLDLPSAVWQSANFDRPKRQMLHAAIMNSAEEGFFDGFEEVGLEILWLLKQADSLEDFRNSAIHAPLIFLGNTKLSRAVFGEMVERHGLSWVLPNVFLRNQRAIKLTDISTKKALIDEFRWAREAILVLRDYAEELELAWANEDKSSLERPSLPNRGDKKKPRSGRRRPHPIKQ